MTATASPTPAAASRADRPVVVLGVLRLTYETQDTQNRATPGYRERMARMAWRGDVKVASTAVGS